MNIRFVKHGVKGMNILNHYIGLKKSNCKNCYKCIRYCPVKSIRFSNNQANIVEDECILCGMCFVACPQNAKEIRNDVDKVVEMLKSDRPVYASIAPSFVANYENCNISSMEKVLMGLGFAGVEETAIGATIVKTSYEEQVKANPTGVLISSCCHTVNTLIQKYYPEALAYLSPVLSPMQAHCAKLKEEHPESYTVFIGPCISKKEEAAQYPGTVDCVLTFEELTQWFQEEKVVLECKEEDEVKGRARLFPTAGGILRTMNCDQSEVNYISIDGVDNCIQSIKNVIAGKVTNCFIEMSACVGSCIGGPAMSKHALGEQAREPITELIKVNKYAGKDDFCITMPTQDNLRKHIAYVGLHRQMPGSKAIEEILQKMGKMSKDQELNCGSCGYSTCREKAIAVYMGKADLSMCLPYLKERAESFSDTIISNTPNAIIVLNEDLEVQQVNQAACSVMNIKNQADILNCPVVRVLDPIEFINVLTSGKNIHDKKVYLAEYKKYVEQTVIYDKIYHIIMIIMRDITIEEQQRAKKEAMSKHTVEIADRVIEKQMRVVQEIASLLGETTAETKIALTNLKETLSNE